MSKEKNISIPWSEQEAFLESCANEEYFYSEEYGDLTPLVMARVKDAFAKYGDAAYHYSNRRLMKEEKEEEADRLFYKCLRLRRHLLVGQRTVPEHGREAWE